MNNITLKSTLVDDSTEYAVSADALTALVFDPEGPAPTIEVSERYSSIPDKVFLSLYEAYDSEPDPDLIESGVVWFLCGEAKGRKVWLTLTSRPCEDEEKFVDIQF